MTALTDDQLLHILDQHRYEALGYWTDQIVHQQQTNLERYQGFPYGDEQKGRSSVVSEDSAQVVDWTLPDLLEPFVSGEAVVQFTPQRPEDEDQAKQATDYVNHIFNKDNPGFSCLYSAAKDGLIQMYGVTKVVWQEKKVTKKESVEGINIARLQELRADDSVTITSQSSTDITPQDAMSMQALSDEELAHLAEAYPDGKSYDVEYEHEINRSFVEVMPVPPEEFRISPRQATLERSPYLAHECLRTRSELEEMGFPVDIINTIPPYSEGAHWRREKRVRFWNERRDRGELGTTQDESQDKIMLQEEYLLADLDGDGETEVVQVFRVHDFLLSKEVVDEHPFCGYCPIPMPHKVIGESLVDKVRQTQRIKTVLTRNLLDNVYLATNPQREVPEDAITDDGSTIDDLLTFRVGGLVRTKKPGMLREMAVADRSQTALQSLGYFDMVRDMETGAVRGAAGMSSEAIDTTQPITAEEARRTSRSQLKRTRMMARVFAETYLMPLMMKIYRLVVKYQDFERVIRLRGQFVSMDPRHWNADMDVECHVGLGYPDREERLAASDHVLGRQVQALQMGMSTRERIYNTLEVQTEAAGMGDAERYYVDPASQEGQAISQAMAAQPQEQDPAAARVQQDGQLKAMKLQQDGQLAAVKMQQDAALAQAKAEQDAQIELLKLQQSAAGDQMKTDADFQADMARIQAVTAARMEQINRETALKIEQMNREMMLAEEKQEKEFALALRSQNLQALTRQHATDTQASVSNGNGIGGQTRFGGAVG